MARKRPAVTTLSTGTKISIVFMLGSGLMSLITGVIGIILWVRAL